MGSSTILLICISFSAIQIVYGQLWEFGSDNIPTAVVISQYNGKFSFFQKEQHIQLIVPPCHVVTYVNVEVENPISSPTVYYNYETNIITIHYSLWQISPSTFTISAKAVWKLGCYDKPPGAPQGQNVPQGQYIPPSHNPPQGQYIPPSHNPPQGQFPPQGKFPPHGQFPPQGHFPPQGQFPPRGQFPPQDCPCGPQGQYPPQGQNPPQGQHAPQGPYAQQDNQYRQTTDDAQIDPQDQEGPLD